MKIEGFELLESLGERPGTAVWKARHVALDRIVALRILDSRHFDDAHRAAIVRDVSTAAKIKHRHLPRIYDVGTQDHLTYIVMEFVDGPTVTQLVTHDGPLSNHSALQVVEAAAEALAAAEREAGLVHGNLTPANLMLDETGAVKLADLGMTPPDATEGDPRAHARHTPHFRSPEHAAGRPAATVQSNMYCLGTVLYYMLTGRRPFDDKPGDEALALHATGYLPNPRARNNDIPPMTIRLLSRMLAKQPEERYADWAAAIAEIEAVAAGRILIRKRNVNPASTIDRRTPGRHLGRHAGRRATDRARLPTAVRAAAWLLLLAFWAFLAYRQSTDPLVSFDVKALFARPRASRGAAPSKKAVSAPAPAPAFPARAVDASTEDIALAEPEEPPAPPAPAAPTLSHTERASLERARRHAAAALLAGDAPAARSAVRTAGGDTPSPALDNARTALLDFIEQVANIDQQVADAFAQRIGSEVIIDIHGVSRRIIPRAVDGRTIRADLVQGTGSGRTTTAVAFQPAELTPDEKLRWLDPANPAVRNTVKLLLHAHAGDRDAARALAPLCGPLAEALGEQLQRDT